MSKAKKNSDIFKCTKKKNLYVEKKNLRPNIKQCCVKGKKIYKINFRPKQKAICVQFYKRKNQSP